MTREEAIEELKAILEMQYWNVPWSKAALDMAIKALEQEPVLDKIRTEIEKEADASNRLQGISEIGLRKALKILDKYTAEMENT